MRINIVISYLVIRNFQKSHDALTYLGVKTTNMNNELKSDVTFRFFDSCTEK